jgi:hypothetical protein
LALVQRFGIHDRAAARIGQLVHDLDLKQSRYGVPEAPSVRRLIDGLRQAEPSDHHILEKGIAMIDALHRALAGQLEPVSSRRRMDKKRAASGSRIKSL